MTARAVLHRPNLGRGLTGGEERIARGEEGLFRAHVVPRPVEVRMRALAFPGSLFRDRQKVSVFSARGHWNRAGNWNRCSLPPLLGHAHFSSLLGCATRGHHRARTPGRSRPSIALCSSFADVCSSLI